MAWSEISGHGFAGATGSAAGMLHRLGMQKRIPSGKGSLLPFRWVSDCLCFPSHQTPAGWV